MTLYRRDEGGAWKIHVDITNDLPDRQSDWEGNGALMELIFGNTGR